MSSYVFTDKAEHDLEKIVDYSIEHWGDIQAVKYVDAIEEVVQMLADNPDLGLNRDVLSSGVFSFPCQFHILYYIKAAHGVSVIRILHSSMDTVKHLKQR